jgi:hypothetical protein
MVVVERSIERPTRERPGVYYAPSGYWPLTTTAWKEPA